MGDWAKWKPERGDTRQVLFHLLSFFLPGVRAFVDTTLVEIKFGGGRG